MSDLIHAVRAGASPAELLACDLPTRFRAAYTLKAEIALFAGTSDKDVRRSIHVGEVEMPELAPDEVVVAVMASAVNFNSVWSAIFEPVPTFTFLRRRTSDGRWWPRHDREYHVIGSDASGVVVRTGEAVWNCSVGDRVVIHPGVVDPGNPYSQDDGVMAAPLAWGYETNFGGMADFTIVKANQIIPKPECLTWEEAAANTLCAGTAYRMLIGRHGARMKQGDIVLIWGATGGLGSYAIQFVLNGGGIPVCVVSSSAKAEIIHAMGGRNVIDRTSLELGDHGLRDPASWRLLGRRIRELTGQDPHIVFEYLGQETFAASVGLARTGGSIVTCGSSTGYWHQYDNRYLWMRIKRIIGSHGANYQEATEVNRLISLGTITPTLSRTYPLEHAAEAVRSVQQGDHIGKIGIRCLAPSEGLGVTDLALRERIGEDRLGLFRSH
ncbi:crotonyl-CoA carboxylase/reductase [Nonomuraea guangzhouensis]|uniref:Crotonyl-CoA carboxylase/reductase n=1 Tax=Nonomuraea guangzhouensis TaxID=1291555 RepID=A0ABW4GM57_9ACTN|nr:crotonyl-CoA carboxylase/reductase [Nonomuraea guangzhouensis]